MKGFVTIVLKDLLRKVEEKPDDLSKKDLDEIISSFHCPFNNDVEDFLHNKAIIFEQQSISATHLVFASYKEKLVLAGYFTLTSKYFNIDTKGLNSKWRRRINRFGSYDSGIKKRIIGAPLIGQIGKNFEKGYNKLIRGDELLKIACDMVRKSQAIVGGKVVYLECEDKPKLVGFYEDNGFIVFGKRYLEEKEGRFFKGEYLLQMLKYLD